MIIISNMTASVKERGVVPTVKLLQGQWTGIDLSNYFIIGDNSIHVEENSQFEFNVSNDSLWIKAHQGAKGYNPIPFTIGDNQFTLISQTERVNYYTFKYVINDIAGHFNGGGHKLAAGATVDNSTFLEIEKTILSKLNEKKDTLCQ